MKNMFDKKKGGEGGGGERGKKSCKFETWNVLYGDCLSEKKKKIQIKLFLPVPPETAK